MERGDKNASVKKARVDEPRLLLPVNVKQEVAAVQKPKGGGGGGGAVVVAAAEVEVDVKFDLAKLHCPVCSDRMRPPVFQCAAACHMACSSCQSKLPGKRCHSCDHGDGSFYVRSPLLEGVVCGARVQCAYHQHGCRSHVAYYEARDHESVCPHAPCSCTEPGCAFVGSPPNLLAHLADVHSWPVHSIRYATHNGLGVRASERRVLLVAAEDDEAVFLLAVDALAPGRAVSVVCVRASGEAGQQYALELRAHGSGERSIMMNCKVTSSAAPGEVAMETAEFLTVPPVMMIGPQADREMVLTVRIDETF